MGLKLINTPLSPQNRVNATNYSSAALDAEASAYGERFRALLQPDAQKRKVYVNFGNGDEALGVLFGGQERLERLRGLKKKWDPEGVFSFYHALA
jgi:hypothetical protein